MSYEFVLSNKTADDKVRDDCSAVEGLASDRRASMLLQPLLQGHLLICMTISSNHRLN